ncbi:MAG: hypothetical protein U1F49_05665 [Rubrivivax sp.]
MVGPTSIRLAAHRRLPRLRTQDIDTALKEGSVAPYQALESGGRFYARRWTTSASTRRSAKLVAAAMRTDNADDIDKLIAEAVRPRRGAAVQA